MSSDRKQDVGTKTAENERIQVGVLRALVDEAEERDFSTEDDEDDQVDNKESEKSDDTNKTGLKVCCFNFSVKHCLILSTIHVI